MKYVIMNMNLLLALCVPHVGQLYLALIYIVTKQFEHLNSVFGTCNHNPRISRVNNVNINVLHLCEQNLKHLFLVHWDKVTSNT